MSSIEISSTTRPARASWIVLLVAIGICLLVVLRVLAPFASVLLLAVVAAGLIYPHYKRLVRRRVLAPQTAALIVCVLLLVTVLVPLSIIATDVSGEALGFYEMTTTELTERGVLERLQQKRRAHRADQLLPRAHRRRPHRRGRLRLADHRGL